ncbi:MAG TPA: prepilin-type N-terminal cleavage/methylation domain-containing protein [Desulfobacteria bacterium]|nr:prepilin-type N-terminal cleavage/methylation domain-containing protein [Desulfobacteria bacterium]
MKNENGFTLVELLAVIVISMMVLGVGLMASASMGEMWSNTSQNFTDSAQKEQTIDTLSQKFAYAVEMNYTTSDTAQELRLKTGIGRNPYNYVGVQLNHSGKLYLFNVSQAGFYATSPSDLTNLAPVLLADNVQSMGIQYNNADVASGSDYKAGEKLTLSITFLTTHIDVKGQRTTAPQTATMVIKLLKDY